MSISQKGKPESVMKDRLRERIVEMITRAGEGHIPSAFSIVDLVSRVYERYLRFDPARPDWQDRDRFILSKGHGCAALYVVLEREGFLKREDLDTYSKLGGILGGHPDRTKVPGVEASTGSLGHGFPFAVGTALGLKIAHRPGRVFALVGDGECHEGTVWEAALVAQNLKLNNLCVIVDYNGSAAQILPHPNIIGQWQSFGWEAMEIDGHDARDMDRVFQKFVEGKYDRPLAVVARTVKGKGVSFLETHGPWHHKIPNPAEYEAIMKELNR